MSKAYDRVNRKLLFKTLERIRIPIAFINLLKDALENRSNKILTAVGDTEEYIMMNGIDQGEIISPTLWIIYYNPLFERIKKRPSFYNFFINTATRNFLCRWYFNSNSPKWLHTAYEGDPVKVNID